MNDVCKANRLRTFLQVQLFSTSIDLHNNMQNDLLMKLRRLRVLTLVGVYLYNLPDSVGELKHLRYLELSDTKIISLPKSICSLYNLQTLKLIGCYSLMELPKRLHDLINLRYLDITGTCFKWMPLHMSKLRNLQKLSDFFLGNQHGSVIGELGELNDLHGSLFIHGLEHIVDHKDSERAKLKEKSCLDKLSLDWCGSGDTDDSQLEKKILASLQPNTNLKELVIHGYPGTEFPKWIGDNSFFNMVSLQLKGCKYCCKLPALGQLPSLKELRISRFDGLISIGTEFFGNETHFSAVTKSFPALEILRFEHMSAWEKWSHDADTGFRAFSQLRELHIQSCAKLTGDLPCNLPSLKLLIIADCNQLLCSLPTAPDLRVLNIQNCGNLEFPVHGPHCYLFLTSMYLLESFDSLKFLPLDLSPNLKSLDIWGCKNLEALTVSESDAASPPNLPSLRSVSIRHCPKLASFPKGALSAPKLTLLTINYCEKLKSLPEQMHLLMPSLKEVQLRGCPLMESSDVRPLRIRICDKLREEKQNLSDPIFASFKRLSPICSPSSR
ncbi:hypothetical protein QN277_011390 [Acacia crassicarpa]|uniref:R13L1/DRL21-like LRR repeat region domain-containing protein n=2 Tax=Acacia crassicarpa TaxID=499986 RepID=A0AAE1MYD7_9FABA|nr:hypothetical protein QN277_011390 [Acacia crassicarpa]